MHFNIKIYLKSNRYYTTKHTLHRNHTICADKLGKSTYYEGACNFLQVLMVTSFSVVEIVLMGELSFTMTCDSYVDLIWLI